MILQSLWAQEFQPDSLSCCRLYSDGLGVWFMTYCCCLVEFGSSCFNHAWIESWFVWFGPWYTTLMSQGLFYWCPYYFSGPWTCQFYAVYAGSESSRISLKKSYFVSEDGWRSYGFGMTQGWVINDRINDWINNSHFWLMYPFKLLLAVLRWMIGTVDTELLMQSHSKPLFTKKNLFPQKLTNFTKSASMKVLQSLKL